MQPRTYNTWAVFNAVCISVGWHSVCGSDVSAFAIPIRRKRAGGPRNHGTQGRFGVLVRL